MSPLMLVNWHVMNLRFRALMWAVAAVLAAVIILNVAPKPRTAHARAHARETTMLVGGLRGRP